MKHNRLVALVSLLALTLIVQLSLTTSPSAGGDAGLQAQVVQKRTLNLPEKLDSYANISLPAHFKTAAVRRFDNTPTDNPTTDAGATLGRVLFYDTQLSANKTFSCGSCHEQKHGFSEPRRMSKGFTGGQVDRNAMSLVELRFHRRGRFFWDERALSLEKQVLMPIQNKTEMGQDLTTLVTWLEKDPIYPKLFARAFGDSQITSERIGRALAQFLRSLVSYQSRYDEGLNRVNSVRDSFPNFTNGENRGKGIFVRNCGVWIGLPTMDSTRISRASMAALATLPSGDPRWGNLNRPPCAMSRSRDLTCTMVALPHLPRWWSITAPASSALPLWIPGCGGRAVGSISARPRKPT